MRIRLAGLLVAIGFVAVGMACGTTLDANFSETVVTNAGTEVTGLVWAPDGSDRLFVARKTGEIRIIKNGTLLATPFATISPVYAPSNEETGLVGICLDPNFAVNGYVYVFVTVSNSEQQIIRYTAVGDIGTAKTILISGLPTRGFNHNGGGIEVGPDGKLYWAIGDNGNGTGVDGDLSSLASKVSRANLDGSVPSDNPFVDGAGGNNDYIWARGVRNPFTLTFQPDTGLLWVNVVGGSYEQIFQVNAGDNAGWNDYENNQPAGYIKPRIKYRTNGTDSPAIAGGTGAARNNNVVTFTTTSTHGFRRGEKITVAGVANSSFDGAFYVASVPSDTTFTVLQTNANATSGGGTATTLNQGGCVTGGTFYFSSGAEASYRGNFFYGDYNSGRIMRATIDASNEISSADYFASGIANQLDIAVGPDGALYYAGYGGDVYRLAYTNFASQQIVVTPTVMRMVENGLMALTVRLATVPASNVQVNVSRSSGDPDVTVNSGSALTFTTANWSVPQTVIVRAAADADTTNGAAILTLSATGVPSETVTVRVLDVLKPFSMTLTKGAGAAQVGLTGETGKTYVVEANTNLLSAWTPFSTNLLITSTTNITDLNSTNLPRRFYRARLVP